MATGTAIATTERGPSNPSLGALAKLLDSANPRIQAALGKAMTADRMIQVVRTSAFRTPDLARCEPSTVLACVMRAATLRLDLEPSAMEAYLIPRRNGNVQECTFQIGYQGIRKLVYRGGNVRAFETRLVYSNEPFKVRYTPALRLTHEPIFDEKTRGDLIGGYGYGRIKDGDPFITHMTLSEIKRIKARGKGKQPAWESDFEQMCHKTLCIRLGKLFPKTQELIEAMRDDYEDNGIDDAPPRPSLGNAGLKQRLQIEAEPDEPTFTADDGVTRPVYSEDDGTVPDDITGDENLDVPEQGSRG